MSYLPRMSKTYKEPQKPVFEEVKPITFNNLPPASSKLNEKTLNPQTILKHYHYFAHSPPVLPGPSVLADTLLKEKLEETLRKKSKDEREAESPEKKEANANVVPLNEREAVPEQPVTEKKITEEEHQQQPSEGPTSETIVKTPKSATAKRKPLKKVVENRKKEDAKVPNPEKVQEVSENKVEKKPVMDENKPVTLPIKKKPTKTLKKNLSTKKALRTGPDRMLAETSGAANKQPKKTAAQKPKMSISSERKSKDSSIEQTRSKSVEVSVQCDYLGNEKIVVVPSIIKTLFRTLNYLLEKLPRETIENEFSEETKHLFRQVESNLAHFSNQECERRFILDVNQQDPKRLREVARDVRFYIKKTYGDSSRLNLLLSARENIMCQIAEKDFEAAFLNEKLMDQDLSRIMLPEMSNADIMSPELALQNTTLENEQLRAEVEINDIEMRKLRKNLAETDVSIKNYQDEISSIKKKLAKTKSKGDSASARGSISVLKDAGAIRKKKSSK